MALLKKQKDGAGTGEALRQLPLQLHAEATHPVFPRGHHGAWSAPQPGLTQPPLQGRKTVGRKEASREATALPREAATVKNEEQPHSKAPDRGAQGARALSTQLPAETEEPDGGTGESNLITSLMGLCKSKVPAAETQGAGMGRASCWEGTWGIDQPGRL